MIKLPLARSLMVGLVLCAANANLVIAQPSQPDDPHADQAPLIVMAPQQRDALGIRSGAPVPVSSAWGAPYPAKVVVPNAQLRVISAPQTGLLTALLVAEGESVRQGQALAVIHSPQLVEQQSAYLEAVTARDLAAAELARDHKLVKDGIIAERRYLETRARHQQAETRVEQYRQALQLAGMDAIALNALTTERRLNSELQVRAPLDGVVLEQLGTPGQRLDLASPLYRVARLRPLWLEIHVPLEALDEVGVGASVKVDAPAIVGEVITIGSMIHSADQGVLVRSRIDDGADRLRPGQFVQARLAGRQDGGRFRIPRGALLRHQGKTWLMTVVEGGFRPLAVDVINAEQDSLVITGKLSAATRIAVAGTAALKAAWLEGAE